MQTAITLHKGALDFLNQKIIDALQNALKTFERAKCIDSYI